MMFKKTPIKMLENKKSSLCGPEDVRNPEKQKAFGIRLKEETKLNSVKNRKGTYNYWIFSI